MKCYFGGIKKKKGSICNFLISDFGFLHRNVVKYTDKLVIEFLSLLYLFEFITSNSALFQEVSYIDIYGDAEVLHYLRKKKVPIKINPYKESVMSYIGMNAKLKFQFFNISKKANIAFFAADYISVDPKTVQYVNTVMEAFKNDQDKN